MFRPDMIGIMYEMTPHDTAVFWSYVNRSGDCWIWKAGKQKGYGRFVINGKTYRSNRIAYSLIKGPIGKGLCVCHKCDNPCCVNPDHLWLGTSRDNTRDMIRKRRHDWHKGKNPNTSSKYLGVSFRKDNGKWKTSIMKNYQVVWRGQFDTEEEAHQARVKVLAKFS